MLNFAKASPSSTAVIRLLRRRGVFWTKESFFYNARWKILIDKATSKNELLIAMMTFISIFSCYTVACSRNHKLWAVTCKRGSFLPGDVKCKHRYFYNIVVYIQRNKRKAFNEKRFRVCMHRAETWWYFSAKTYL